MKLGGKRETLYEQGIRRIWWAWNVTRRRDRRVHTGFWWRVKERDQLEDLGVEERIILKLIRNRWDGKACIGFICLRIGTGGGRLQLR